MAKFLVIATLGMCLGKTLEFSTYEDASEFADLLVVGQPIGTLEVVGPQGTIWSYTKTP